jgi:hypothetical protein
VLDCARFRAAGAAAATAAAAAGRCRAATPPPPQPPANGAGRTGHAGHKFFGNVSRGLASVIERAVSQWGLPNGYVLGEEGSRRLCRRPALRRRHALHQECRRLRVYWQGPSVGFDWGGDGARTMTLVYNLPATNAIYQRFAGIDGSAYIVGGFGMTALTANNIVLVPIRSGIGCGSAPISAISNTRRARPGTRSDFRRFRVMPRTSRKVSFLPERLWWLRIHVNAALGWRLPAPPWHCD